MQETTYMSMDMAKELIALKIEIQDLKATTAVHYKELKKDREKVSREVDWFKEKGDKIGFVCLKHYKDTHLSTEQLNAMIQTASFCTWCGANETA